jgi:Fur family transcriptional regulator, ferric uptake regulator
MTEDWRTHARAQLAGSGRKWGAARLAVVDVLAAHGCCLSARDIEEELQARGARTGLASVYRALELLHQLGLVQRLDMGDGTARYEPAGPGGEHHHHVICDSCGQVSPFADESLEQAIHALAERVNHVIDTHDVVLRGECAECAASSGTA